MSAQVIFVRDAAVRYDPDLPPIQSFRGEHYFLSNFQAAPITWPCEDGSTLEFSTSEHLYMWHKTDDVELAERIRLQPTPGDAKRLAKTVPLRPDWEEVKDDVMYIVLRMKFLQNQKLAEKLIATGDCMLIEGNTWHDTYWGVCNGKGQNMLGKLLMLVRQELREQKR